MAAGVMPLVVICLIAAMLLCALQVWGPHYEYATDLITAFCVGRVTGNSWWGVWWVVPAHSAARPREYASPQALCGYIPRPPFVIERGSLPLSP